MTTDAQLQTNVLDDLKSRPSVNAGHIGVTAKNGWVTLTGTLDRQYQKDAAARSVRNLMGAIAVCKDIKIKPEAGMTMVKNDLAIVP